MPILTKRKKKDCNSLKNNDLSDNIKQFTHILNFVVFQKRDIIFCRNRQK